VLVWATLEDMIFSGTIAVGGDLAERERTCPDSESQMPASASCRDAKMQLEVCDGKRHSRRGVERIVHLSRQTQRAVITVTVMTRRMII